MTELKLYNTLTKKKEKFAPRKKGKINLFVCGPTVYDFAHLGHAKTYVAFDVIVKYLKERGDNVFYLQNITDIDDKIIKRAGEMKTMPQKLAQDFEKEYFRDIKNLKITSVTKYARATEYIKEIISQVQRLLKKGFAYKLEDGVYYNVKKFKNYGKLARRTVLQAEDGVSRIDDSKNKKNKGDFCLWKFSKPGEPKWQSPLGAGRPGWHIEDTAITEKYFGPQYDIHGGGRDLIFPHHEAEIAQMEAISGKKPMVKYWLHIGFLTVRNRKMAKSLGNFITIQDFLKNHDSRILRFFFTKTHYRSPIDYNEKVISQTKKELNKIDEFLEKISKIKKEQVPRKREQKGASSSQARAKKKNLVKNLITKAEKEFEEAMDNDFNTPIVIASLFDLINKGNQFLNKNWLSSKDGKKILVFLKKIDKVLGFIFWEKKKEKIPLTILEMVEKREKSRKEKKWQEADKIRKEIEKLGYKIEDTLKGPKIGVRC